MGAPSFHTIIKLCGAFGKPQISLPNNRNAQTGASQRMPRSFLALDLIFPADLLRIHERIRRELRAVEVGGMELHAGDLAVIIGRVVINAPVRVAAAGIERDLILAVVQLTAAALLLHAREDVEKLADVGVLGPLRTGVGAHERRAHEPRGRRQVARQAERAHAAAVERDGYAAKIGRRLARAQASVTAQRGQLLRKRRVVRQHPDRVVIDVQAVRRGLDHDAAAAVGDEPVQLRARQLGRKRCVVHDHARERIACLGDRGARAEQPRDECVLRHRGHALCDGRIDRVAHKVQPRDAQALLVDRVIIERVVVLDMRHADHGIMPVERAAVQADRVIARRDGHVLAVGKFVVQIAAEIKIAVAVCRCGTHEAGPPSFIHPVSISAAPGRMLKNLKSSCVQSVSFMCLTP